MTDIANEIAALTDKMHILILGRNSAVAMGALLNLVMTVSQQQGPEMRPLMAH